MLSPQAHRIYSDAAIKAQTRDFDIACKQVEEQAQPLKVLIVEDVLLCQKVTLAMLSSPQFITEVATTGEEALEKYTQGFDVILLDLGLPKLSGFEVYDIIRKQKKDTQTPIIAHSAMADSVREQCFSVGFNAVLSKPCAKEQLQSVLQRVAASK
jgi:CheY-like chemotaxis protein